ncbi:MAG: DUF3108 domain-containing protein [Magnetococcales bacterium]|nr:DUF3108 domain-containing protein [Magnetococcales bacterium]MBF0156989.1 DUF3108 domain-containing protein [Magnetococcales bacterium]
MSRLRSDRPRQHPGWSPILLALGILVASATTGTTAPLGPMPGEALTYDVRWTGIPSGESVMEALKPSPGRYQFRISLKSSGLIDVFYPINDLLESEGHWRDGVPESESYVKKQREGNKDRLTEYRFERDKNLAIRTFNTNEITPIEDLPVGTNDPVTVLFALRFSPQLVPQTPMTLPVLGGREWQVTPLEVSSVQTEKVPAGQFEVFSVTLNLGLFNKKMDQEHGTTTIWFTNDERRIPIKVWSKLKVGDMEFSLKGIKSGSGTWP